MAGAQFPLDLLTILQLLESSQPVNPSEAELVEHVPHQLALHEGQTLRNSLVLLSQLGASGPGIPLNGWS